jgi:D-alanyl-lipoteichoic acid acyltransferase DltB (MBOAT superfamily)
MLFNSIDFLIFFPLVVIIYFSINHKWRWLFILAASYLFYGLANGKFLFLIILSTLIDYWVGIKMGELDDKSRRKPYLYISLFSNLGLLVLFKYFNFFNDSFADLFRLLNLDYAIPALKVILPVGISFYTFQTIGYSIDVFKGKIKPEKHLGYFALYVTYFPQLVAGPIERSSNLIPQLKQKTSLTYENASNGLKLMAWGFFKKVVIADQIAPMIKYVTDSPDDFYSVSVLLVSILFAYQIYCDFSGYSDIAIGAAQIFGIKLMLNFRRPFSAKRLSEFWARWHISLTGWFKDYVYMALGGSSKNLIKTYRSLFLVFFLSGLWHGANYNFIIWGALNGFLIIFYSKYRSNIAKCYKFFGLGKRPKLKGRIQILLTSFSFCFLGIFFFTKDIGQATTLYENFFFNWIHDIGQIITNENDSRSHILYLGYGIIKFSFIIGVIVFLEFIQSIQEREGSFRKYWGEKKTMLKWSGYLGLTLIIILFSYDMEAPFIYFQF